MGLRIESFFDVNGLDVILSRYEKHHRFEKKLYSNIFIIEGDYIPYQMVSDVCDWIDLLDNVILHIESCYNRGCCVKLTFVLNDKL